MKSFNGRNHAFIKAVLLLVVAVGCFYTSFVFAQDSGSVSGIATNIRDTFSSIARMVTGGAYLAGLCFAIASILKFKQHKEQPQSVQIGVPVALLFVAVAFLFLPTLFRSVGKTVFGGGPAGSLSGETSISGPTT